VIACDILPRALAARRAQACKVPADALPIIGADIRAISDETSGAMSGAICGAGIFRCLRAQQP
jgi:hypothetical protein